MQGFADAPLEFGPPVDYRFHSFLQEPALDPHVKVPHRSFSRASVLNVLRYIDFKFMAAWDAASPELDLWKFIQLYIIELHNLESLKL